MTKETKKRLNFALWSLLGKWSATRGHETARVGNEIDAFLDTHYISKQELKEWVEGMREITTHEDSCEIFQIPEIPRCSCDARETWLRNHYLNDLLTHFNLTDV